MKTSIKYAALVVSLIITQLTQGQEISNLKNTLEETYNLIKEGDYTSYKPKYYPELFTFHPNKVFPNPGNVAGDIDEYGIEKSTGTLHLNQKLAEMGSENLHYALSLQHNSRGAIHVRWGGVGDITTIDNEVGGDGMRLVDNSIKIVMTAVRTKADYHGKMISFSDANKPSTSGFIEDKTVYQADWVDHQKIYMVLNHEFIELFPDPNPNASDLNNPDSQKRFVSFVGKGDYAGWKIKGYFNECYTKYLKVQLEPKNQIGFWRYYGYTYIKQGTTRKFDRWEVTSDTYLKYELNSNDNESTVEKFDYVNMEKLEDQITDEMVDYRDPIISKSEFNVDHMGCENTGDWYNPSGNKCKNEFDNSKDLFIEILNNQWNTSKITNLLYPKESVIIKYKDVTVDYFTDGNRNVGKSIPSTISKSVHKRIDEVSNSLNNEMLKLKYDELGHLQTITTIDKPKGELKEIGEVKLTYGNYKEKEFLGKAKAHIDINKNFTKIHRIEHYEIVDGNRYLLDAGTVNFHYSDIGAIAKVSTIKGDVVYTYIRSVSDNEVKTTRVETIKYKDLVNTSCSAGLEETWNASTKDGWDKTKKAGALILEGIDFSFCELETWGAAMGSIWTLGAPQIGAYVFGGGRALNPMDNFEYFKQTVRSFWSNPGDDPRSKFKRDIMENLQVVGVPFYKLQGIGEYMREDKVIKMEFADGINTGPLLPNDEIRITTVSQEYFLAMNSVPVIGVQVGKKLNYLCENNAREIVSACQSYHYDYPNAHILGDSKKYGYSNTLYPYTEIHHGSMPDCNYDPYLEFSKKTELDEEIVNFNYNLASGIEVSGLQVGFGLAMYMGMPIYNGLKHLATKTANFCSCPEDRFKANETNMRGRLVSEELEKEIKLFRGKWEKRWTKLKERGKNLTNVEIKKEMDELKEDVKQLVQYQRTEVEKHLASIHKNINLARTTAGNEANIEKIENALKEFEQLHINGQLTGEATERFVEEVRIGVNALKGIEVAEKLTAMAAAKTLGRVVFQIVPLTDPLMLVLDVLTRVYSANDHVIKAEDKYLMLMSYDNQVRAQLSATEHNLENPLTTVSGSDYLDIANQERNEKDVYQEFLTQTKRTEVHHESGDLKGKLRQEIQVTTNHYGLKDSVIITYNNHSKIDNMVMYSQTIAADQQFIEEFNKRLNNPAENEKLQKYDLVVSKLVTQYYYQKLSSGGEDVYLYRTSIGQYYHPVKKQVGEDFPADAKFVENKVFTNLQEPTVNIYEIAGNGEVHLMEQYTIGKDAVPELLVKLQEEKNAQ